MIQIYRGTEINIKLSTLIVYTFDLSDILSDLFISNSTLFIVFKIGSILILKVTVSGSLLYGEKNNGSEKINGPVRPFTESGRVIQNQYLERKRPLYIEVFTFY